MRLTSPETDTAVEAQIYELFRPTQKVVPEDCQRSHLYWVGSSFGPTALCIEKDYDGALFLGVTISLGANNQPTATLGPPEKYYYEDPGMTPDTRLNRSTVWAFRDLGETSLPPGDPNTLNWILSQDLTFHEQRLTTLQSTASFQGLDLCKEMIENETKNIALVRGFLQP